MVFAPKEYGDDPEDSSEVELVVLQTIRKFIGGRMVVDEQSSIAIDYASLLIDVTINPHGLLVLHIRSSDGSEQVIGRLFHATVVKVFNGILCIYFIDEGTNIRIQTPLIPGIQKSIRDALPKYN